MEREDIYYWQLDYQHRLKIQSSQKYTGIENMREELHNIKKTEPCSGRERGDEVKT